MSRTAFELVIFDLDGTLIDSKLDLAHAVNAARAHHGMGPLSHELIYSYVGNGAPVLIRRAMGPESTETVVNSALMFFLSYYRQHKLDFTTLYPGVEESLAELEDLGVRMAILTNKPVNITKEILDGLNLSRYFFQVYGGNSFEQKKPDPVGILALLEESGAAPEKTLMVGDSSVDILTARNAGVASAGCTWGFQPESLVTHPPDWLIERMSELSGIVVSGNVRSDVII